MVVGVQVIDFDSTKQMKVALIGVFVFWVACSNLKDAVQVTLRDDSQSFFIFIFVFPLHSREDQIDGFLVVHLRPLQINHVIRNLAVQGLVARSQDLYCLGLKAKIELVFEVW